MSKTKGGLGRGLGALIPDLNENIDKLKKGDEAAAGEAVYDLPLADKIGRAHV